MIAITTVFKTGNNVAVRLPEAFRTTAKEMWITQNKATGEITLRPKDEGGLPPVDGEQRRRNPEELFRPIAEEPLHDDLLPQDHQGKSA